jgi:rhamnose transport system permease protein
MGFRLMKILGSWEMILVYMLVVINLALMIAKANVYFLPGTIQTIIRSSLDLSFMVLGMVFILLLGDIDVSIASIMIACAMTIGIVFGMSGNAVLAILFGLGTGALCGLFNGILVALVEMPAVIVTIASSMLFRGIVQIIMGTNSIKTFPLWFGVLSWDSFFGIPVILWCFTVATILFGVLLHRTSFGRKVYIIGNNHQTAAYSGIPVKKVKILVFIIMGLMCAVSSIFFIGRFSGLSSAMATGYELDTIAITVLGGVSTMGGKGRIYGPFIAALVMEFLFYMLGLFGVEANTRKIITGVVLIIAVTIPLIKEIFLKGLRDGDKHEKKVV